MIPFFEQPSLRLGPVEIKAFGVVVAAAAWSGLQVAHRRFARHGLDQRLGEGLGWWAVVGGFIGAHLFSVIFYFPEKLARNPLVVFKVWEDISSFGGILGGLLGMWLFLRARAIGLDRLRRLAYLDVAAFAFPIALAIGRIGCLLAHDHPGAITSFPLAVSLETEAARRLITTAYGAGGHPVPFSASQLATLAFHDLGWYEFLYLGLVVVPITLWLGRTDRPPGFFIASFVLLYMPVRFLLDFLRVSDLRYAGLTPAQWVALGALVTVGAAWRNGGITPPRVSIET